jgi:hypothetical protein
VTERVEGVAVTPEGRPLSVTVTGLLNPFTAVVVTVKDLAEPPLCRATELGAAVMVKSGTGAAEIERAATAVWVVESAAPETVTIVDEVGAAEFEAASMNCPNCPGDSESVEGLAVTPEGSPVREIATGDVLPFTEATVTVRAWAEPPLCNATAEGAAAIVKLGRTAGPEDVPHPRAKQSAANDNARMGALINNESC